MCSTDDGSVSWPSPDWARPWNAPFASAGAQVRVACEQGAELPWALTQCVGALGPRFVPQADLPGDVAYEQFIFDNGSVPTREGLHDFFNGLVWMRFPATKRQLNRLQAAEIQATGVGRVRGPVRDAITLFDENAVLLQAPDALWQALWSRQWHRLFVELRPLWVQARLVLFGHALLEKLVAPYKSITGHVYREPVPLALGGDLRDWDHWLTAQLTAPALKCKPFTPLPVLGVPGWWAPNTCAEFYDDPNVFRPAREALLSPPSMAS